MRVSSRAKTRQQSIDRVSGLPGYELERDKRLTGGVGARAIRKARRKVDNGEFIVKGNASDITGRCDDKQSERSSLMQDIYAGRV